MIHFHALKVKKSWLRWGVIMFLALFTALFIWIDQTGIYSTSTKDEPAALVRGNPKHKHLALTFNISWGEEKVHSILEVLDEYNLSSTFFVSGEWAEKNPDLLEDISEHHEIGMLGYRYKSYLDQEIEEVRKDLYKAREVFSTLGYEDIELLRPPSGHLNEEIIELAEQLDFQTVHWNVNPNDWENPGTEKIIDHVLEETNKGDIILLHASDAAKQTADALQVIIPAFENKGFEFVMISELIHNIESETKLIE